jgi:galactitol-specific phosphotransferase system IIC component
MLGFVSGRSPRRWRDLFFGIDTVVVSGAERTIQTWMMILQLIWAATLVPGTKSVPLEQIQKRLGMELSPDEL